MKPRPKRRLAPTVGADEGVGKRIVSAGLVSICVNVSNFLLFGGAEKTRGGKIRTTTTSVALSYEHAGSVSSKKQAGSAIRRILTTMGFKDESDLEFSEEEIKEFKSLHEQNKHDDIKDRSK